MRDLGAFLLANGHLRRQSGTQDCCTFPAAWAIENGWHDPMAAWRGLYATEEEADDLICRAGGLVEMFREGAETAGIPEVDSPTVGDIGVLSVAGEEAGAIFTGRRWAVVADRGLGFSSVSPEAVLGCWRVVRG